MADLSGAAVELVAKRALRPFADLLSLLLGLILRFRGTLLHLRLRIVLAAGLLAHLWGRHGTLLGRLSHLVLLLEPSGFRCLHPAHRAAGAQNTGPDTKRQNGVPFWGDRLLADLAEAQQDRSSRQRLDARTEAHAVTATEKQDEAEHERERAAEHAAIADEHAKAAQ